MSAHDHHDEYGATFVAGPEWMWGEGFFSPGGEAEVALIVAGAPIVRARVLDVGSSLGAIDVLLVERLGPASAAQRLESTSKKKVAVDGSEQHPGHLRARKPL